MATQEELLEYKNSDASCNNEIDNQCCWGVAYEIHETIWDKELTGFLEDHESRGYLEEKITFYPKVGTLFLYTSNAESVS